MLIIIGLVVVAGLASLFIMSGNDTASFKMKGVPGSKFDEIALRTFVRDSNRLRDLEIRGKRIEQYNNSSATFGPGESKKNR